MHSIGLSYRCDEQHSCTTKTDVVMSHPIGRLTSLQKRLSKEKAASVAQRPPAIDGSWHLFTMGCSLKNCIVMIGPPLQQKV